MAYPGTVGVGGGIRARPSAAPPAAADLRAPPTAPTHRRSEEASCRSETHTVSEESFRLPDHLWDPFLLLFTPHI